MLIQLSIDVWMDVLDFLRGYRRELAEKCNQLGDRMFVNDICGLWLHKRCRNVNLGYLYIEAKDVSSKVRLSQPKKRGQLSVRKSSTYVQVPFAEVPMPESITSFKEIRIEYLDWEVLNFLRQGFFANNHAIDLSIDIDNENMRTALEYLLPLLTNVIGRFCFYFSTWIHFPSILDQFPDLLFSVEVLTLSMRSSEHQQQIVQPLVRWLSTPRADLQPRMASLITSTSVKIDIVNSIREQFLAATSPVSFFLRFWVPWEAPHIQESSYENGATGEQLILKDDHNDFMIGRCPLSIVDGNAWLLRMRQKEDEVIKNPRIIMWEPLLGPMNSNGEEEEGNDDNDDDGQQQPGPSNKAI